MNLQKPKKLTQGDKIATISPCFGIAGESQVIWKYNIGRKRLEDMGLTVLTAPNSMRGEKYLKENPKARAEDILWAFENKEVKAIISNIGGNDSEKVLPFLNQNTIKNSPKIFVGYSDILNFHLFCYKAGLSTFYGHNLLPTIAETPSFHPYSNHWFEKFFFDNNVIGEIPPSLTYSCDDNNYTQNYYSKTYYKETGYTFLQGNTTVQGQLFGGHTGLRESDLITANDFENKILFIEDIPLFFSPNQLADFIDWLGKIGALQKLKGLLIGKLCEYKSFEEHKTKLLNVINNKYQIDLPIIANVNFGHSSPICILPFGALAEIDCINHKFSILENVVI